MAVAEPWTICISEDSPGVEDPVPWASALPRDKDQSFRLDWDTGGFNFEVDSNQRYANRVADDISWVVKNFW